MAVQRTVEDQAHQWRHDQHREDERREQRPVVVGDGVVEDRRRHEGLGAERQVEHARRLVRQDEPDGDEREHAPERDPEDDVVEEVAHAGGLPFGLGTAEPTLT
jgi:hypothetical protein